MRTQQIIKRDNVFRVYCNRIGEYRDAVSCEMCRRYVPGSIDPVTSTLRCREEV